MRTLFLALAGLLFLLAGAPAAADPRPVTILVSIDGFRADYLDRGVTPTLSALAADGVRAAMRPSFPSKTFPNHYALVTGLRPDRNGIVDNNMRDPAIPGVTFKMSNLDAVADRRWWDEAEPVWVTAEAAGVKTGTMFWPGSEAPIHGRRPSYWIHFDAGMRPEARVDQVLAWLDLPDGQRPGFVCLYFDAVDTAGHYYGPTAPETNAAITATDAAIGRLTAGLKARGIAANIVVVADHGMAALSQDRRLYIDDFTRPEWVQALTTGAFLSGSADPAHKAEVEKALLGTHPHMTCWLPRRMPGRFHYGRNPRAPGIFCLPETGWTISFRSTSGWQEKGTHGFDPYSPEMAALFVASGPAFRPGVRLKPFDNVDVYPLLMRLIGVKALKGDGTLGPLRAGLKP